jgi:hypothetical protein
VDDRVPVEERWTNPTTGAPYDIRLHVLAGALITLELADGHQYAEVKPGGPLNVTVSVNVSSVCSWNRSDGWTGRD